MDGRGFDGKGNTTSYASLKSPATNKVTGLIYQVVLAINPLQ
jgi:hypothetical protein